MFKSHATRFPHRLGIPTSSAFNVCVSTVWIMIDWLFPCWSPTWWGVGGGGGESGMGDTQQSFIRGVPPPGSNPLPFYILFPTDKVPLSYTVERPLTATFPFFGAQSVHRRFFKPFSNSHLSTTFFRLKVASSIDDGSHFTSLQNNTAFLVTAVTGPPFEYQ